MPTHKIVGHPPKGRRKADGTTPIRNTGALRARRLQRREEAEARNAKTKPENRRATRRHTEKGKAGSLGDWAG